MVIWLWINTYRYSLLGDEHPFATYFDVHQGYKVFTHCHMFGVSYQSCLEMLGGLEWLCLKICYPQFQWIMITIPIKNGPSDGIYLIFRHTHMRMGQNLLFPFWVNKQPLYFTVLLSLVIYHPSNVPIIRKKSRGHSVLFHSGCCNLRQKDVATWRAADVVKMDRYLQNM